MDTQFIYPSLRTLPEFTAEKWEEIRTNPYYRPIIDEIHRKYARWAGRPVIQPTFEEWMLFYRTGDRTRYSAATSNIHDRYSDAQALYLLEGDPEVFRELCNALWATCDMACWSLPAHVPENETPARRRRFLDLCSCERAFFLSETVMMLRDVLPPVLAERIRYEIKERVLIPFVEDHEFWWMKNCTNNWAAVCAGSVAMAMMTLDEKELLEKAQPMIDHCMETYLNGFADDGCCTEGMGYWNYGFGYFAIYAEMRRRYTGGKVDLFKNEKVRRIAHFQQSSYLGFGKCLSFSDSGERFSMNLFLSHLLHRIYPTVTVPPFKYADGFTGEKCSWLIRHLIWSDPTVETPELAPVGMTYYEEAQWYINRRENDVLAVKGGCNAESHNHNDIGSFMYIKNGVIELCDPGHAQYDRDYVRPNLR